MLKKLINLVKDIMDAFPISTIATIALLVITGFMLVELLVKLN